MSTSEKKNESLRNYCRAFSEVYHAHYEQAPPAAQPAAARWTNDVKYLDLLSTFHFVLAGVTAVFACLPILHLVMGIALLTGAFGTGADAPPAFVGWLIIIMACIFITAGWSLAVLMLIVGRKLKHRINRFFCMVAAGIECVFMPFGTVLGVFTIIVLSRDPVVRLFEPPIPENPETIEPL